MTGRKQAYMEILNRSAEKNYIYVADSTLIYWVYKNNDRKP